MRQGKRPRRPRRIQRAEFLTMNVNCANRLKDEVLSNDIFHGVQGVFIQEHREHDEGKERLVTWLRHKGWDPVAEDAYFKKADYGGGTLIMSRGMGIRPLERPPADHVGRVCWGEADVNGSVLCASVYGISGQGAGKQIPLLSHIIQRVVTCGLPCVLAGDWQLAPDQLRNTGITRILDADIISSCMPTNVVSGVSWTTS